MTACYTGRSPTEWRQKMDITITGRNLGPDRFLSMPPRRPKIDHLSERAIAFDVKG